MWCGVNSWRPWLLLETDCHHIQPATCCWLWAAGGQRACGRAGLGLRGVRPPRSEVPGSPSGVQPPAPSPRSHGAAGSCLQPSLGGHRGERRSAVRGLGLWGAGATCGLASSSAEGTLPVRPREEQAWTSGPVAAVYPGIESPRLFTTSGFRLCGSSTTSGFRLCGL